MTGDCLPAGSPGRKRDAPKDPDQPRGRKKNKREQKKETATTLTADLFPPSANLLYYSLIGQVLKNMRPDLIRELYEKEATYWWNVCKREMVSALSGRNGPQESRPSGFAIDIGCGGGYTAKILEPRWRTVAADLSQEALQLSQQRGVSRLCQVDMTRFSLPFKNNSFDLILALDVIEHVEDDVRALAECRRILKDDGLLIVTVPAFMWLWSPWDDALGHRRRYTATSLADSLHRAGLAVKKLSYSFFFIFPIAVLVRGVKRLTGRDALHYSSDFIPIPSVLNSGLIQAGRLEQWIVTKLNFSLPIGLSVISVATKR